jgi:hypothetical protein
MTKKEYLIKILEKLREYRSLADGILALLEETELDENIIDWIIKLIENEVKKQKTEKSKQRFVLAKETIKKLQEQESLEDDDNIDDILNQI